MPVGHLQVFFEEVSIQVFCPFLIRLFVCFWHRTIYILDINPLLVLSFANIFSHSVGCLFVFLMVSFVVQKILSIIGSHLFILAVPFP